MAEDSTVEVVIDAVTDAAQDGLDSVEQSLGELGDVGGDAADGIDDASDSLDGAEQSLDGVESAAAPAAQAAGDAADGLSDAADEADSAAGGLEDASGAADDVAGSLGDAADSTDDVAGSADAAAGGLDDAAGGMDDAGAAAATMTDDVDSAAESLFDLEAGGVAAGAAVAGVGAAAQGAISGSQDWRESLGRTSQSLNMTQGATEDLASEISNVTFPMDDAVGTMDVLAQQGIESEDAMKDVASVMDNVADATDSSAQSIAENAGPALRAFGNDLEDAGEHADTFTFIARNTTLDVEEFSGAVERLAPELQEMGLSMDETAQYMAALEEKGITGRAAIREIRQAANDAEGDQDAFADALGVTSDELDAQAQALEDAEGITDAHADAANESLTTMDKLGQTFDEVKLMAGGLLGPIDALAPAMMAMGGAASTLSAINTSAVIPSLYGIATALWASGIAPILLGIAAAVGVLAAVWKTDFMGMQSVIEDFAGRASQVLAMLSDKFLVWVERIWTAIQPFLATLQQEVKKTMAVWMEAIQPVLELLAAAWEQHGSKVMAIVQMFVDAVEVYILTFVDAVTTVFAAFFALLRGDWEQAFDLMAGFLERTFDRIVGFIESWGPTVIDAITGIVDDILQAFRDLATDLIGNSVIPDMLDDILSAVMNFDIAGAFSDSIGGALDTVSGMAGDFASAGESLAGSVADGIQDKAGEVADAAEGIADTATDYLPGSDAERGPLSDLSKKGPALSQSFADGIEKEEDSVGKAAEGVAGAATSPLDATDDPKARSTGGGGPSKVVLDPAEIGLEMVMEVTGGGPLARWVDEKVDVRFDRKSRQENRRFKRQGASET